MKKRQSTEFFSYFGMESLMLDFNIVPLNRSRTCIINDGLFEEEKRGEKIIVLALTRSPALF
jgi:hypothetical protein